MTLTAEERERLRAAEQPDVDAGRDGRASCSQRELLSLLDALEAAEQRAVKAEADADRLAEALRGRRRVSLWLTGEPEEMAQEEEEALRAHIAASLEKS